MTPSIGGVIAVIDERGSRFATKGLVRGWMPVPGDGRNADRIHINVDGAEVAVVDVCYSGQPYPAGNGYVERYLFSAEMPPSVFGRTITLDLHTDNGAPVGVPGVLLDVDAQGDAILKTLNEAQRDMLGRAADFVKRGRPGMANLVYQQVYCADIFGDHAVLMKAARAAADVYDISASTILFDRALACMPEHYAQLSQAGKVLLKLDRNADAKAFFDRAIALDPAGIDARNGRIKAIIGESDWPGALLEAHRLRRDIPAELPAHAEICGTIAWLYLNLSEPLRALTEAIAALRLHPSNIRLMQMKGDALVRLSCYDEAIVAYREALVPDNKVPLLRKRLATALMLVGDFGAAADQDSGRMYTPTFARLNNVPEDLPLWRGELKLTG